MEDKKHRAVYQTLADSDKKLQYFSARQIACRLLGSRGYLCQKVMWQCQLVYAHLVNHFFLQRSYTMQQSGLNGLFNWSLFLLLTFMCPFFALLHFPQFAWSAYLLKLQCWLPMEDCMCAKLGSCNLWQGIRFWLYMHPKVSSKGFMLNFLFCSFFWVCQYL